MKIDLLAVVLVGCLSALSFQGTAVAADKPNIIFIMADDLGWQDVGYMGAEYFETPHIDRFAAQGLKFTAAYSGGPNCAPTRTSFRSETLPDIPSARVRAAQEDWRTASDDNREETLSGVYI